MEKAATQPYRCARGARRALCFTLFSNCHVIRSLLAFCFEIFFYFVKIEKMEALGESEIDIVTHHLLTGLISVQVVDRTLEKVVAVLGKNSSSSRSNSGVSSMLRQLWLTNLAKTSGVPLPPDAAAAVQYGHFDVEAVRRSDWLKDTLSPVVYTGLLQRPAPFMQRPSIDILTNSTLTLNRRKIEDDGLLIEEAYVMKSVRRRFTNRWARFVPFSLLLYSAQLVAESGGMSSSNGSNSSNSSNSSISNRGTLHSFYSALDT